MEWIRRPCLVLASTGLLGVTAAACYREPALPTDHCTLRSRPTVPIRAMCGSRPPRFTSIAVSNHVQARRVRTPVTSDVDGDQRPELLILSPSLELSVQAWREAGGFGLLDRNALDPGPATPNGFRSAAPTVLPGDVDEDGWSDLTLCWPWLGKSECWTWLRRREGGYRKGVRAVLATATDQSFEPRGIGDFNCDGHLDIVGVQRTDRRFQWRVRIGNGVGDFAEAAQTPWETSDPRFQAPGATTIADVNGDGNPDLVGYYPRSYTPDLRDTGRVGVSLGTILGVFHPLVAIEPELLWSGLTAGDLDGDGRDEIIARRPALGTGWDLVPPDATAFSRFDDGSYHQVQNAPDPFGRIVQAERDLHLGRFSCPDRLDLLSGGRGLLRTDARGQLQPAIELPKEIVGVRAVADFNQDGLDDLLALDYQEEQVTVWLNQTPQ